MPNLRACFPVLVLPPLLLLSAIASAQARFDLAGPRIDVRDTRGGMTLPIASVPNLQPGDQLWLHPDLPPTQSVHYLLVVSFLRGTTNPPPDDWFTRIETWKREVREEGVTVSVPAEAQQAVLFLVPETGGDFTTLRSAVKGRPGIFVRASQDLSEASFEQARIEKYLAALKQVPPGDPAALAEHSNLLARTLNLRPNPECFKRPLDQQFTCLTQTGSQTLLDDGHGQTIVAALSSGSSSDFINAASNTQLAGGGTYSAYVGAIVDLVRLTSNLHTAQFQYIPAIAFPDLSASSDSLNLRLNTAPSFHNPKSVIVIGLPAIQKATLPPLRPADPNRISCLLDPRMVLPIEGAPLVFTTAFAHDLTLHLNLPTAVPDLPLVADAFQGGLSLAPAATPRRELTLAAPPLPLASKPQSKAPPQPAPPQQLPGTPITGTIHGLWGFDPFTGPTLPLQQSPGQGWRILTTPETPANLIAGQPNHLQLASTGTACIRSISLGSGDTPVEWKLTSGIAPGGTPSFRPIDLTLNLQHASTPGSVQLSIQQFGAAAPDQLGTRIFAEPARIDALRLYSGDSSASLSGSNLAQVKSLILPVSGKDLTFAAGSHSAANSEQTLFLSLPADARPPALKPGDKLTARVQLEDGRTLPITTTVLPARPSLNILSRRIIEPSTMAVPAAIHLNSEDDLPLGAQLTFFLKSKAPFPRTGQIEIAQFDSASPDTPADALHTTLSVAAGTLVLQDAHTLLATFDPLKLFGASTFGPFRLRALAPDGTRGDWVPLATIVRLPALTDLHCPVDPSSPCLLSGSSLYLMEALSTDAAFNTPLRVPEGFVEPTLSVPHPTALAPAPPLYLRLRDDPSAINPVTLPVSYDAPPPRQKMPGPKAEHPPAPSTH